MYSDGRRLPKSPDVSCHRTERLTLSNIVTMNKMGALNIIRCPDFLVENSVFMRPQISNFMVRNEADEPFAFHNNIFTDMLQKKAELNINLFTIDRSRGGMSMNNNVFLLREFPPETRHLIGSSTASDLASQITNPVFVDPQFQLIVDLVAGGANQPAFSPDRFAGNLSLDYEFDDFFATEPDVVSAGIGLDPSLFENGIPR